MATAARLAVGNTPKAPAPASVRTGRAPAAERTLLLRRSASRAALGRSAAQLLAPDRHDPSAGVTALRRAAAARRTLARDQDPGAPEMPELKGLTCGFKDGKPFCTVATGKGEPLEVDPSSLTPDVRRAAFDEKRPKSCPPHRWNWYWQLCCPPGKHFDSRQNGCRPDATPMEEEPLVPPPAPPPEKGDFPLPAGDPAYA